MKLKKIDFLINPDSTFEDYKFAAKGMIERVEKVIASNFDVKNAGLDPKKYVIETI